MKRLGLFLATAALAFAEPRTVILTGTLFNTTGEVSAPARLELTIDGTKASARIVTFPPLTGTGTLEGRCLDGWCDLRGSLDGGFTVQFRGVLNARDFRGTYTATPAQGRVQYGKFDLALAAESAPAPAK